MSSLKSYSCTVTTAASGQINSSNRSGWHEKHKINSRAFCSFWSGTEHICNSLHFVAHYSGRKLLFEEHKCNFIFSCKWRGGRWRIQLREECWFPAESDAIGCMLVALQMPCVNLVLNRNQNENHSLNIQLVCDDKQCVRLNIVQNPCSNHGGSILQMLRMTAAWLAPLWIKNSFWVANCFHMWHGCLHQWATYTFGCSM